MALYNETLYTRVDKPTKEQIALAAAELGMSQAQFIRSAIALALADYREYAAVEGSSRAPVVGGEVLPISEESAIAIGVIE